jgi:hypothetical protein
MATSSSAARRSNAPPQRNSHGEPVKRRTKKPTLRHTFAALLDPVW